MKSDQAGAVTGYSRLVSLFCITGACLVLAGYFLDFPRLTSWDMKGPAMIPLSAICLLLAGTGLLLFSFHKERMILIISGSILTIITLNFISAFTAIHLDQMLFIEQLRSKEYGLNQMALPTGISYSFIGLSYILYVYDKNRAAQLFSLFILFISLTVMIAYVYAGHPIHVIPVRIPMAMNTSLSILFLSSATVLLYTDRGFAPHILGMETGARMAQRFIPLAVLFVFVIGLMRIRFVTDGATSIDTGLAIVVSITIVTFLVVIYSFSVIINRTERKLEMEKSHVIDLNNVLSEKNDELSLINEEIEKFAFSVSHDIRSPLGGIMNSARRLLDHQEKFTTKERDEFLELIKSTSASVIERSDQMLNLAKASRKPLKKTPVDTDFIVVQTLREIEADMPEKTIVLDKDDLPVVLADKSLLKSVFYNLIHNAVRYCIGNESKIRVSCEQIDHEKIFTVEDNGIGLDMKKIDKIFQPFQRYPTAEDIAGTGLGLSIVKRIIERHGGKIWAKPGISGGAVFYFSLPSNND